MSNEIATYSMILSKLSLGKSGTECPTKTQILAINSLIVIENASTYGANECVKIDDIRKKVETWNYYLTVSPTSMSFGAGGGSKSFTVSSYKRKVLDGVEQSGDTSVSLKSTTISGTGFSLSGTTVSASANESTSNRTGTVTITQNESNKTATISLSQSGDDVSSYGEWTISVSANPTSVSSSGGTSTITASAKRTVYWTSGDVTEETGNPTLSTNLGSLSSSSSPSTLTLGENTSTSSRTATIKATHGGKSATCTVTQSGATPSTTYTFSINPYKVNVGSSGGSGSVTIRSYKTVGSSTYDVDYSIDSSTLPSWASFNKSTSTFTIQSTTSTIGRTARVYFYQDESGKQDYAELTQTGYIPPADTYVFTWEGGSTSDVSASFPWDFSANGTAANIPVISTKNGSSQSWSVSSKPSWITTSTTRSNVTISASDNSGSARSGEVVLTQSGSGKTLTVNVSQDAYVADTYVFTWEGGSTSDVSASFPWDFSANGTAANIPVISTKNGSSQSWSVSSKPSWITTSTTRSNVTISASDNSGSARSGEVVLTQSGSGKTLTVNVSQDAYVADTYVFTITPNTYDAPYSSTSFIPRTVSTKNGSNIGYSLTSGSTDWVVVDTTGKITVKILKNTTSSTRSTTLVFTQNKSGKTQSIEITQSGYTPTYTFNVIPTNLVVDAISNTYSFTVNSSKTILNDDGSESSERIGWTGTDDADWIYLINASNRPNQIETVTNETTLQRTAKITLTQDGTGIQAFVNVIQEAGVESNNELYIDSINYDSVQLFGNGESPHSGSQSYFLSPTGIPLHWKTSKGLVVNGGTVYAGYTISVYVSSNNSYTRLRGFTLETGVQRVIV